MKKYNVEQLPKLFEGAAAVFAEKKEELCSMDANMGDGDLGLTMSKGFEALPDFIRQNMEEKDAGKTLMKAAMKMAGLVPSTMGTLMSSGILEGGKALKGTAEFGALEMVIFLQAFAAGIQKRGKCQPGDCTILDAMLPAAEKAAAAEEEGGDLCKVITMALEGAKEGVESTKNMVPKFGKAAVFSARAVGTADQGATAGMYFLEGLKNGICS